MSGYNETLSKPNLYSSERVLSSTVPAISIMTRINHPQRTLKSHLGPLTRGPDASVGFTTRDSCLTQAGCQFESCQTSNGHLNVGRNEATGRPRFGALDSIRGPRHRNFTGGAQKNGPSRSNISPKRTLSSTRKREREGERVVERIRSGPTTQFRREEPRGPRRVLIAGYGACN